MAPQTLKLDIIRCDGHGICAEMLPEWIRLDDWGFPAIRSGAIPPELLAKARWAVANCPVLALRLESLGSDGRRQVPGVSEPAPRLV